MDGGTVRTVKYGLRREIGQLLQLLTATHRLMAKIFEYRRMSKQYCGAGAALFITVKQYGPKLKG
jgi:hypothetical protein